MKTTLAPTSYKPYAAAVRITTRAARSSGYAQAVLPTIVVAVAVVIAWFQYAWFQEHHRSLWTSVIHDRSAHYLFGIELYQSASSGSVRGVLSDLNSANVWPPLHGILVSVVLLWSGPDYRFAVLPNLIAWVAAALFAFLAGRRMVGRGGNLAGVVAAALVLTSPAHKAYAIDLMLESLGACLTLAALYAYLVTKQSESVAPARWLGLTLTLLFLEKTNYWLLVVVALAAAELFARFGQWKPFLQSAWRNLDLRAWMLRQLRSPLAWGFVLPAAISIAVLAGWNRLRVFGHEWRIDRPHLLITLAYAFLFCKLALWWRASGNAWSRRLDPRLRQVLLWHAWPVAIWFLWPRRLSWFLWYVLPFTNVGELPKGGWATGLPFYAETVYAEYHAAGWVTFLVAILMVAALVQWRSCRSGVLAVLCFLLIAAALTIPHPNRKGRFVHSWIPAAWLLAGAGAGAGVARFGRALRPSRRTALGLAAGGGLALALLPHWTEPGRAAEGGVQCRQPSILDLSDAYLPWLAEARAPAILATMPMKEFTRLTYFEAYPGRDGRCLHTDIKHWDGPRSPQETFHLWLEATPCDRLVFIDIHPGSRLHAPVPDLQALRMLLAEQKRFVCVDRSLLPHLDCEVTFWVRVDAVGK